MIDYIEGKISELAPSYIVVSSSGIGYKVFTPNPFSFKEEESVKIYIYNYIREDEYSLYGFRSKEERELFLKLLNVKGLGPKVGITILASSTLDGIMDAIDRENILYLKKFPKVGEKLARQIILDLKGKLVQNKESSGVINDELNEALLSLGYKGSDIKRIAKDINYSLPIEEQIKEALKLLIR